MKKVLLVNGFIVLSSFPSKSLLNAYLPEVFKNTKIGNKSIELVKGYFYNKLGNLAKKYYTSILPKYAINAGFAYVVPKNRIADFLKEIEELKEEYRKYERQLKEFLLEGKIPEELLENDRIMLYEDYIEVVKEYLRENGAEDAFTNRVKNISIADRVRIDILPLVVDFEAIEEYLDEKAKKVARKEIERIKQEIVKSAEERLRKIVKTMIMKIENYKNKKVTKKLLKSLSRDLKEAERLASGFGLDFKDIRKLRREIENALSAPEEIELNSIDERLKEMIRSSF